MHVAGRSNVIIVTSPPLLHNFVQTTNGVGNTGGGTAKTTHVGDPRMLLETVDKQVILIMKQAYFMPSNNRNTFGFSPFLIHR